MIEVLVLLQNTIEWLADRPASAQVSLCIAILRVWVLYFGANKLALPQLSAVRKQQSKLQAFSGTDLSQIPLCDCFGVEALRDACAHVVKLLCHSALSRTDRVSVQDCFRNTEGWNQWQGAADAARHALREHAQCNANSILHSTFDTATPHELSLVVCTLDALGFGADVSHILAGMSRHKLYEPLNGARRARRAGDFVHEACFAIQYLAGLAKNPLRRRPVDGILMLEQAVAEIMIALAAQPPAAALGLTLAQALTRKRTPLFAYMARSLAQDRFENSIRVQHSHVSKLWEVLKAGLFAARWLIQDNSSGEKGSFTYPYDKVPVCSIVFLHKISEFSSCFFIALWLLPIYALISFSTETFFYPHLVRCYQLPHAHW